jgi:hypothetical protein
MTMTKTYDPVTDTFHYDAGPDGHVVLLGAASAGVVTLPDGTQIDTAPEVVEAPSQLHAVQLVAAVQGGDPAAITQEHVDAANDPNETEKTAELAALLVPAEGSAE